MNDREYHAMQRANYAANAAEDARTFRPLPPVCPHCGKLALKALPPAQTDEEMLRALHAWVAKTNDLRRKRYDAWCRKPAID